MTSGEKTCHFKVHALNPFMVNAADNEEFKKGIEECELVLSHTDLEEKVPI